MRRTKFNGSNGKPSKTGPKPAYLGRLHDVYCYALLGATNKDLARLFKVTTCTIEYWLKHYPDFKEAKESGMVEADAKVAYSMYRRSIGYDYEEKEYKIITNPETGEQYEVMTRRIEKHMAPDTKAGFKWMSNRHRDKWTEAGYIHMKHTHEGGIEHIHREATELDTEKLSDQAKELLFELNMQQLEQGKRSN